LTYSSGCPIISGGTLTAKSNEEKSSVALSKEDRKLIEALRRAGVLQDIDEFRINLKDGIILISCGDADRFPDILQHQQKIQLKCRPDHRIHLHACNGGALAYAPNSPVNKVHRAHRAYLSQLPDSQALKGINTVVSMGHWLCGAADFYKVSLETSIKLQFQAKAEIKKLERGFQVISCFDIDYDDAKKQRTYHLSRENWDLWVAERHINAA
jgi:hypothetical protein